MERKLASVQQILDIQPIEGADKIERATINGWHVVTAKENNFKIGDWVVYFEIDSWIPHELAPFLSKGKEPRVFEGVRGERLRTIKLRGQVSQGLIMPNGIVPGMVDEGQDVTELLGIKKWEKPINPQLHGVCRGNFPSFLRKTDQERVQNILREVRESFEADEEFEITEKIDGSSMTVYHRAYEDIEYNEPITDVGVCSRNLDLKMDQEGNAFVNKAINSGLVKALRQYNRNIAVQGELYGEGIQGNNEGIVGTEFAVFDIFDIDNYRYLTPYEREAVYFDLLNLGADIKHVPVLNKKITLDSPYIEDILKAAEGKNSAGNEREGIVFKSHSREFSFKAISDIFLLGEKD